MAEISADLKDGPEVHIAAAAWRPRDTGDAVITRVRARLDQSPASGR